MENLALKGCTEAHQILSKFFNRIKMLPISVSEAGDDHPLAQFSGDPVVDLVYPSLTFSHIFVYRRLL